MFGKSAHPLISDKIPESGGPRRFETERPKGPRRRHVFLFLSAAPAQSDHERQNWMPEESRKPTALEWSLAISTWPDTEKGGSIKRLLEAIEQLWGGVHFR